MIEPLSFSIAGYAAYAPGLVGRSADLAPALLGRDIDEGPSPTMPAVRPEGLPPSDLRRLPQQVKRALWVAQAACKDAALSAPPQSVFSTGQGDLQLTELILSTLASQPEALSPTRFTNSVLNAASGHWTIAQGAQAASTAICAAEYTAGAGLLQALTQTQLTQEPTLLVTYDSVSPKILSRLRPMTGPFFCAMVLAPLGAPDSGSGQESTQNFAATVAARADGASEDEQVNPCKNGRFEPLRLGNFAAGMLPLLELAASNSAGTVTVASSRGSTLQISRRLSDAG